MYGRTRSLVVAGLGALLLLGNGVSARAGLTPLEELGEALFMDVDLSANRTQACVTCHDPAVGYTGPDSWVNLGGAVIEGALEGRFGNRKPPSAAYGGDSPVLYYDEGEGAWVGGMFWDGRATGWILGDPLAEQAQGPFLNPLEQAVPGARQTCIRVAQSDYAGLFEDVWGPDSLDFVKDVNGTYERIARSIAAYERSAEVNPFTSKFDLFLDNLRNNTAGKRTDVDALTSMGVPMGMGGGGGGGNAANTPARWEYYRGFGLDDLELQGLAVFKDRADCARCHTLESGSDGYPLFTDYRYHNIGTPKNPENPFYAMPKKWNPDGDDWVDYGLGGFLKSAGYPPEVYEPELGKFKTPTLRNVDLRPSEDFVKAYGHNGFFKSLDGMEGIIHFYAWRAMMDEGGMGGGMGGGGMGGGMGGGGMGGGGMGGGGMDGGMEPNLTLFPPPEVDQNRAAMQFFNFMVDGDRLLAFMKTLSDGYFQR